MKKPALAMVCPTANFKVMVEPANPEATELIIA